MSSSEIDNLLVKAIEKHNSIPSFVLLGVLSILWLFTLTELLPTDRIDAFFNGLIITPTALLFIFVLVSIYGFAVSLNRRLFNKKLLVLAEQEGLSKTEIELFLVKQKIRNAALDGNLHGQAKKNIERLRKGS